MNTASTTSAGSSSVAPGGVERGVDDRRVGGAGAADRLGPERLLATGEEVVHGAERRPGLGHDLLHAGGRVALAPQQPGPGVDDAVARGHVALDEARCGGRVHLDRVVTPD